MRSFTAQSNMAWAEGKALQRCNLSADPGAKTGAGIGRLCSVPLLLTTPASGIGTKAKHLRGRTPRNLRQDVTLHHTNTNPPQFPFPLNQHSHAFQSHFTFLSSGT